MAKMKAYETFDLYLAAQPPKNKTIIRALRKLVAETAPKLQESVKWGNGCWLRGKVPIAYVYSDKGYVQFGFIHGSKLPDPKKILHGKGAYVRHIKVHDTSEIDAKTFATYLRQAIKITPASLSASAK